MDFSFSFKAESTALFTPKQKPALSAKVISFIISLPNVK
jgi:hypothetical protein